jgi:hypothetical protein
MRKLALFGLAAVTGLMFSGCADEYGYYDDRPGYYSSSYDDDNVDFYYVSSHPYSRLYGELYLRDGRYYYSRGGRYVVYDRPTRVYRNTNYRVVNRDVNVRNVRYNNERIVRDNRSRRDSDRADFNRTRSNRTNVNVDRDRSGSRGYYQQRRSGATATQVNVSNAGHRGTHVNVVEKKKEKKRDR